MIDTITVCNAALSRLGEARILEVSDNEGAPAAARACALNFPLARDEVLRAHWWNFAMERVQLSKLSGAPSFGFKYAYGLPMECLRVVEVNGISSSGAPGEDWEIEGGKLLHDSGKVEIRFI